MVLRERLINKLRALGYRFKRDAWRVQIWCKGTHRPMIPKRDLMDDEFVVTLLRQCGVAPEEVRAFLSDCKS